MLRRTAARFSAKNSTKPGKVGPHASWQEGPEQHRAFWSEKTMTEWNLAEKEQANMRVMNKKLSVLQMKKHAIPRDLGELPRTYLLRCLFVNQPVTQHDLWELLKANADCPFDSYRHLEFVLRIALHQNWVMREKNQTDRKWYLSVHQQRSAVVSEALQNEKEAAARAKAEAEANAEEVARAEQEQVDEALELAIQDLQHQIMVNVAVLQEQDRDLVRSLPYVRPDGAIDFAWYREGGSETLLARASEMPAQPEDGGAEEAGEPPMEEEEEAAADERQRR